MTWIRSSYCGTNACVEVDFGPDGGSVLVRNSREPNLPSLRFTREEWAAFLQGALDGEFDSAGGPVAMFPFGTREHAAALTEGRHPDVQDALQWLTFSHLPKPLQVYSRPFYRAAVDLLIEIDTDSPELTTGLNRLIAAKDSAMRAGIKASTGRAGSVPRPQAVVSPPVFGPRTD